MTCYTKPSPIPLTVNQVSVYLDSAQIGAFYGSVLERISPVEYNIGRAPIQALPIVVAVNGVVQNEDDVSIVGTTLFFNYEIPEDAVVTATYCYYM